MSKKMRKEVRRMKRRFNEDLTDATAYMVERVEKGEELVAALRGDNTLLRDALMATTVQLAVTRGYVAAIVGGGAGVPATSIKDVCPGAAWWR